MELFLLEEALLDEFLVPLLLLMLQVVAVFERVLLLFLQEGEVALLLSQEGVSIIDVIVLVSHFTYSSGEAIE
jgi:hypothetical protein